MGDSDVSGKKKGIHKKSRARGKKWKDLIGDIVVMVLGLKAEDVKWDSSLRHDKRTEHVTKVIEHLQNPQLVLKRLRMLMMQEQAVSLGTVEVKNALKVLEKALDKCKDDVKLHKAGPSEVHDYYPAGFILPNSMESLEIQEQAMEKGIHKERKYTVHAKEVLEKKNASVDECLQSMKGLRHHVQEYCGVLGDREGCLKIDSTNNEELINWNDGPAFGKGLESLPPSEMEFAHEFDGKGLEREMGFELTLSPEFDDYVENFIKDHDTCIIEGFKVLNCNANLVKEILQNHPNIAKSYRSAHPDFQSYFMNSIAEVYRKLESKQEMEELINDLEKKMVQHLDYEYQQLIPWVKEMVAYTRESLKAKAERKRLQDEVDRLTRMRNEAELNLQEFDDNAKSSKFKKPRFG